MIPQSTKTHQPIKPYTILKFESRVFDIDVKHGYIFAVEAAAINVYRMSDLLGQGNVITALPLHSLGLNDGIHWMKVSVDFDDEQNLWIAASGY